MPALRPTRILHLEDSMRDAELIQDLLVSGGVNCTITRAKNAQEFNAALTEPFDIFLLDYGIAGYGGKAALQVIRERRPDVPVIMVSGILGEEAAVEWLQWGVTDYVLKGRPARLVAAVNRALSEAEAGRQCRETETALRQAQSVAKLGTWTFDLTENRFGCSEENYRLFGIEPEAQPKLGTFAERVHPEDREEVARAWRAAIEGERPFDITLRIRVGEAEKWIHSRAEVRRDDAGRPLRFIGISQDITERERDRNAVVASEQFINATLSALSDLIIVLDGEGKIVKSNRAWQESGSFSESWAIARRAQGDDYLGILDQLASEGAKYSGRIAELIRHLIAFPSSHGFELVVQVLRTEFWVLCRATLFQHEGEVRIVVSYTDITARRRAEEALRELNADLEATIRARTVDLENANVRLVSKEQEIRSVVDNLPLCVISIDEQGIVQSANPAVEVILGYSVADVLGRNISMLMPEPELAERNRYVDNYLRTGAARVIGIGREVVGLHKDGTGIALDLSISEYFVGGKRFFTGIFRDNRERKSILEALEVARDQAVRASSAKSEFLAVMSHEIRTPMNGVIGMLDVLHLSSLRKEQRDMVDLIHESAYSLLHVIDDILDYSKIEAGRLEIEQTVASVEELIEGVCAMLDRVAMKAGVDLTFFVDPLIPGEILTDFPRLRQVLVNLVGNAIKFCGRAGRRGRVFVSAARIEDPGSIPFLEIRVTDNGIGMDEATLEKLFTPFMQADVSTTRRFGGTGLGLAISHQLVMLMAGKIDAQSRPGVGSTFRVSLPCVAMDGAVTGGEAYSLVAGLRCLVVGGADGLADYLCAYLVQAGVSVQRAADMDTTAACLDDPSLSGLLTIIHDARGANGSAEALTQRISARANQGVEVVALLIERGQRRGPRRVGPNLFVLDGNVLKRRNFLNAVAMVAGRLPESAGETVPSVDQKVIPLPREELRRRGCLILVAEDNEINQRVILAQLNVLGFIADVASDGRDAVRRWNSGQYALLLTDLHMPDMDGYQLTRSIRAAEEADRRTPIIALTATAIKGEAERCRDAGMDGYLAKPVPLESLKDVLLRWLPMAVAPARTHDGISAPMTSHVETAAPVNLRVIKEIMGDNEAVVREVLKDFPAYSANVVAELRAACSTGQVEAAIAAAHKLKSSARAIGAIALSDVCADIECCGRSGNGRVLIEKMPEFDRRLCAVVAFLEAL